eukprot:1161486-Pelagomonas_calceolata.AAC.15
MPVISGTWCARGFRPVVLASTGCWVHAQQHQSKLGSSSESSSKAPEAILNLMLLLLLHAWHGTQYQP